ncbi:MAG: PhoH family protein [Nitrospirales bacterium]|nr:PhoH family protein [Nitrospirales bacterium]
MRKLKLREGVDLANLYGPHDLHLKMIEHELDVRMTARGDEIMLDGQPESVQRAEHILQELSSWTKDYYDLKPEDVSRVIQATEDKTDIPLKPYAPAHVQQSTKKWRVNPKTPNQQTYLEAIDQSDLVIAIGPAGTGKTYLAMAMALAALTNKEVSRIILARPAVEAGEHLGFLPGDLFAKVHPYLRPLYDALYTMMDIERANRLLERGEIEIAPLAFMRGRTLDDAFVILDEAQNATTEQMKMFLTRMGLHSKAIVTGDITQIDLPDPHKSGLAQIAEILVGIEGIQFVYFTDQDVIRHRLVRAIINAYDRYNQQSGHVAPLKEQGRPTTAPSHSNADANGNRSAS